MSLLDLQSLLQQQADSSSGVVTISEATLNSASLTPAKDFDHTIQSYLDLTGPLAVTVTSPIPAPVGNTLTLTGAASFLGVENVTVQVVFTLEASDNTVDLLLDSTLPSSWTFSTSFPLLTGFPFVDIKLTQPSYLLTTATQTTYTWQQQNVTVMQGLNLASFLGLGGPLSVLQGLISSIAPTKTIVFTGPIDSRVTPSSKGTPPVSLTGTIGDPINGSTHFDLSVPQILVTSTTDDNGYQAYWLALSTTLSVNGQQFSAFQAAILPSSSNLTFSMLPTAKPITPGEIIGLIAGVDYVQSIPPDLVHVFGSVGLSSLAASINTEKLEVLALSGGIGTVESWPMGQFNVDSLVLNCQVLAPFTANQTVLITFVATAHIFKDIFDGKFDLEISYDIESKEITIAANFQGTVSINKLVEGLSNGAIQIPPNLADLEFDDFGMTFTKAGTDYNYSLYGSAKGTFNIKVLDSPIISTFEITVDSATNTYLLNGGLTIGDSFFQATANLSGGERVLSGSWSALNNDFLTFEDLLAAFNLKGPQIPPDLDLALKSASITYNLTKKTFVMAAESANYGAAVFVSLPVNNTQEYFFLLGVDKSFNLSNLPLVGEELARIEDIEIGKFQIVIGSIVADAATAALVNNLITPLGQPDLPLLPDNGTTGKFVLAAELDFGDQKLPLNLSIGGTATTSGPPATALITTPSTGGGSVTSTSTPDGTTWYTVQKSFGPVTIQRIGAMYQSDQQTLWFEIDGTLAFGPLSLSLAGLGVGSSIKDFSPQFTLQGLGVSYLEPPLEIAGTLVNLEPPGSKFIKFEGGVTIGTGDFMLEAFGYYGNDTGFSSMFIFGVLDYDFGGPPAFFVTGVALGFGYNSSLRIPTIDEVEKFPFVEVLPTSMVPNQSILPGNDPLKVLDVITNTTPPWVTPQAGSLWFAAGITFTSFELVNSQALVMVEFGSGLVLALVGTSRAQFPQPTGIANEPVYAYIELDLLMRFAPAEGVFSLQAVLAKSSFLLDRACVLTGGFAFFVWFGDNPHAGDFVLTLGGYNPGFTPPSHYPLVPAVGFHWSMDSTISITGSAYFAFTPSVLMVGGELNATYQSGNLRAWFDAHADIIVKWKPFWFKAEIGITVGASYKINLLLTTTTVSVELGCDLELWGPPTGGRVTVNWYIIKFTIPFGSDKTSAPAINGWSDVQAMLPNTGSATAPNVLSVAPSSGISPNTTKPGNAAAPWIVRGSQFGFNTSSPIPATTAKVGNTYTFNGSKFNVAPLSWSEVSAVHNIAITNAHNKDFSASFSAVQIQKSLPASLWGSPPSTTPTSNDQLVPNQIIGVSLQVNPPQIGSSAGPVNVELQLEGKPLNLSGAVLPISGSAAPSGEVPKNSQTTISIIANSQSGINSNDTIQARAAILTALQSVSYAPGTANDPMANFVKEIACVLAGEPLLVS